MSKKDKIKLLPLKITTIVLFILFIIFGVETFIHNNLILDEAEKMVHEIKLIKLTVAWIFVGFIHIFVFIKSGDTLNKYRKNKKK